MRPPFVRATCMWQQPCVSRGIFSRNWISMLGPHQRTLCCVWLTVRHLYCLVLYVKKWIRKYKKTSKFKLQKQNTVEYNITLVSAYFTRWLTEVTSLSNDVVPEHSERVIPIKFPVCRVYLPKFAGLLGKWAVYPNMDQAKWIVSTRLVFLFERLLHKSEKIGWKAKQSICSLMVCMGQVIRQAEVEEEWPLWLGGDLSRAMTLTAQSRCPCRIRWWTV